MTISPDAHGTVDTNGVTLAWEAFGSPSDPAVLLVMGLGAQMLIWPDGFCRALADAGRYVVRFDNRDVGLSSPMTGNPDIAAAMGGDFSSASYRLEDMADDTAGLLETLGLAPVHVVGASMGGMIAQQLAVRHPKRVKSLTLIMTSSGSRKLPGPTLKVRSALISRPVDANNVESVIEHYVKLYRLIGSPDYPAPEAYLQERLGMSVRRSYRPAGTARQMIAIAADGNRSPLLAQIAQPTQIIHGKADPLVPVAAGEDLAQRIAGAQLDLISGMGHDLPTELWPRFVAGIAGAAGRA